MQKQKTKSLVARGRDTLPWSEQIAKRELEEALAMEYERNRSE